jgi:hypothetical protein
MTWGVVMDVAAPVQVYDAVHARLLERTGGKADGLLVHLARATETGFQVVEVWESRDRFEHWQAEVVGPLLAEVAGGNPPDAGAPAPEEFDVRGLVVPPARIAV